MLRKRSVIKLNKTIVIIILLFILIFQLQTTSSSNSKIISNSDSAISSKSVFTGGGGVSKNPTVQGLQKIDVKKNRYASPNNQIPIVTLISPQEGFIDNDGEIEFVYSVEDDSLLRDCYLYHDIDQEFGKDEKYRNYFVQKNHQLSFLLKNVPDGNYHWSIGCEDDAFNKNTNNDFSFTVRKILPKFSAISDLSINEDGILTINLNDYFSDSKGDNLTFGVQSINNFQIKIDNETGIATIEPETNFAGERNVIFTAFDEHGSKINSNPVKISVSEAGDTPPKFILASNQEGENDYDGYVFFDCNVTDDEGLKEISLYSDISGSWKLKETKEVFGLNDFVEFAINGLPEGNYEFACLAKDIKDQETMSKKQKVAAEISVEIVHDIFDEIVNNVEYPAFVGVEYSKYLNDSLSFKNFKIESNGKDYLSFDIANQLKNTRGENTRFYKKITISPKEIFSDGFVSGNTATLKFLIEYTYQGKIYKEEKELTISIKEGGWIK